MHPAAPLPAPYSTNPFVVSRALNDGVSPGRLRSGDLDRSVWGVRATARADGILDRCQLFATRIPDAFFSHTTAAIILGMPLPLLAERDQRVHLSTMAPRRAPHATGIIGHRLTLEASELTSTGDLRHTRATRTWCDLASGLSLVELVAAGDFLIHWRSPMVSREQLASAVDGMGRGRGAARAHEALPLLNDRSESPPESALRLIVRIAALPEPRVNHELVMTDRGRQVRTDLAFTKFRTVLEYQGDYHRALAQWRADMTRRSRLEASGWYVMEINADDVKDPDELAERIRTVLRARGWRP